MISLDKIYKDFKELRKHTEPMPSEKYWKEVNKSLEIEYKMFKLEENKSTMSEELLNRHFNI